MQPLEAQGCKYFILNSSQFLNGTISSQEHINPFKVWYLHSKYPHLCSAHLVNFCNRNFIALVLFVFHFGKAEFEKWLTFPLHIVIVSSFTLLLNHFGDFQLRPKIFTRFYSWSLNGKTVLNHKKWKFGLSQLLM